MSCRIISRLIFGVTGSLTFRINGRLICGVTGRLTFRIDGTLSSGITGSLTSGINSRLIYRITNILIFGIDACLISRVTVCILISIYVRLDSGCPVVLRTCFFPKLNICPSFYRQFVTDRSYCVCEKLRSPDTYREASFQISTNPAGSAVFKFAGPADPGGCPLPAASS